MKKNDLIYLLLFIIFISFSSCATDAHLKSRLVGVWKPVRIGNIDIQKLIPRDDTLVQKFSDEDNKALLEMKQNLGKPGSDGTAEKSKRSDFSTLVAEASTMYKFTSEGLGARDNPLNPVKGTWKFKNKGTRLIITEDKTKEEFVLQIDTLTSTKMVATNKYLPRGMKVTFIKVM